MKAQTTDRYYLVNNILGALSQMSDAKIAALHNEFVEHEAAFETDGEILLLSNDTITQWSDKNVEVFENNDQDGAPEFPYGYYCFDTPSDQDFNTEREAILHAVEVCGLKSDDLTITSATTLPLAKHVIELSLIDPDTSSQIEIAIYKDVVSGGMFAVDSSYVLTLSEDEPMLNPITERYVACIGD